MVDPLMAAHVGDLIVKLKAKLKKTSIVVTHDTHLAKKLADRVIFLQEGRVGFLRHLGGTCRIPRIRSCGIFWRRMK